MTKARIENISLDKLIVSEANVRKHGVQKGRLVESVKEEGVIEPIHVWLNKENNQYEIMQGQHRYHAAAHCGLKEIECILHLEINNLEEACKWCRKQICLQEDLSTADKLQIAIDLKQAYGSLKQGCRTEGLSYSKLSDWFILRKLHPDILEAISSEKSDCPISATRRLKEIARLPKQKQIEIYEKSKGKTDTEFRQLVRESKGEEETIPLLIDVHIQEHRILNDMAKQAGVRIDRFCSRIVEEAASNG